MVKGDSVIAADGHPVYLKIDVEGFEEHVLRGFNNLLSERNVVVQVEVTSEWLRKAGGSAESLFSFMAGLGYFAYKVKTKSGIRTQPDLIRLANPVNDFQYDVYFLPFDNLNDFFAWVSDHGNRTFKWPERLTKSS